MKLIRLLIVFIFAFQIISAENLVLPNDLDKYLTSEEQEYEDITPNTEKTIIWNNESKEKTKYSIVYLHGFSATRQEIAPVCDDIAEKLNANLFYTRFKGHGRSNEAMGEATLEDWKDDVIEAVEIGKRLGEQVVVIGTSTGGTLATWYAGQHPDEKNITYILISPNYAVRNKGAKLLATPILGKFIANNVVKEYSRESDTDDEKKYWTISYPTKAILPMMQAINETKKINYSKLEQKMMIMHTSIDQVVDFRKTDKIFSKLKGDNKKLIIVDSVSQRGNHVLAGDIMSPETTKEIEEDIINFIQ